MMSVYTATQFPLLGDSDHNLILQQPKYRPLERQKPRVIPLQQWNSDSLGRLQVALICTDWDVLAHANPDLIALVESVTDYINLYT